MLIIMHILLFSPKNVNFVGAPCDSEDGHVINLGENQFCDLNSLSAQFNFFTICIFICKLYNFQKQETIQFFVNTDVYFCDGWFLRPSFV